MNKVISNTGESILDNLKERLSSPLAGGFVSSWLAINWDFLYFITFQKGPATAIIHKGNTIYVNWIDMFALPLIFGFVFAFTFPALSLAASWLWDLTTPYRKMHAMRVAEKSPFSGLDRSHLISEYEMKLGEMKIEIERRDEKLNEKDSIANALRLQIAELKETHGKILVKPHVQADESIQEETPESRFPITSDDELTFLAEFQKKNVTEIHKAYMSKAIKNDAITTQDVANSLLQKKLISLSTNKYSLTPLGIALIRSG